ncbi:hypothetical protein JCM10908_000071 [Rhodotorula pacifica]|uniref:uncharacterized protein n=1 Tax=Rhodotorula pacifica TaxID=1495444 RepID=UPI00317A96EE
MMETKALLDQTATEESLSALSTQLVSLGYLSRPLDLSTLFLSPSVPSSASSKHIRKHQDLLILQARAREQIAKCLWGMLEQRQTERATIETLLAREARANEDADRERIAADRARKEREAMGRELEAEKAKAKEAEQKLRIEQDRHRHARDELAKAKNALQFVKTQALHDQKRRESEVQSLHQRLQKLTTAPTSSSSESAFTRFTVLNGSTSPAVSSPVTANFTATQAGRSSRIASRVPAHPAPTSAIEAELDLVRSTLDERISTCSHLERENRELRTFVGEVGEWAEGVLEIEELANVRKDREEGGEMRGVLNDGDESYLIPSPHLALPVAALTSPLHRKLYAIRLGLSSLSEQSAATLASVRDELEGEIERLNEEVEEEVMRREDVEKERETAIEAVRKGEMLVEEWAQKARDERRRRLTGSPGSDDEASATSAAEKPDNAADKRRRERSAAAANDVPDARSARTAARPSAPSAHVADFLADLGLDTPAAEKEKAPLRTERSERTKSSNGSSAREERRRVSSEAQKEKEGEMLPPAAPRPRSAASSSSRPVSASSSRTSMASTTTTSSASGGSSRSSRREKEQPAAAPPTTTGGPSSTLQDILALADSPPIASEPLISASAATSRASSRSAESNAKPKTVLMPSTTRVVNAASTTTDNRTEDVGDRVAAKKQTLLARARSASARKGVQGG